MQPNQQVEKQDDAPPSELQLRFNPKVKSAIIMVVAAVVFIAVSMTLSWWGYRSSYVVETPSRYMNVVTVNYYLGQACVSVYSPRVNACFTYSNLTGAASGLLIGAKPIEDLFGVTNLLMMLGLLVAVLALVLSVIGALRPGIGIAAVCCGYLASIFVISAVIYIYFALPGSFNSVSAPSSYTKIGFTGFFGSSAPMTDSKYSWGGGPGWFFALVAFLLCLGATSFIASANKTVAPLGNYRPAKHVPTTHLVWHRTGSQAPPFPGYSPQVVQQPSIMICNRCGCQLYPEDTYCRMCGAPLR